MDIGRVVAVQIVHFVAAAQATAALVLHGVWLLLLFATWPDGSDIGIVSRPFFAAFAWLGGIEAGGRGDEGNIAQAMALLTLPLYLLASLRRPPAGGPPPLLRRVLVWSAVSGAVALAGYARAFWTGGGLEPGELAFLASLFATLAAGATAWAIVAARVGDLVVARLRRPAVAGPGAASRSSL